MIGSQGARSQLGHGRGVTEETISLIEATLGQVPSILKCPLALGRMGRGWRSPKKCCSDWQGHGRLIRLLSVEHGRLEARAGPRPTSHPKMPQWYVIQCRPREELRALENLERQGLCCYLPMLSVEKLRHGALVDVREPLFPGYLFISLDELTDNWHPIRSTRGVIQLVRFREYPEPVAHEMIESIRQRLASDAPRIPYLKPGERVRITQGPFSDVEAIFVANDGEERVVLLMNVLNREQRLSFPAVTVRRSASNSALQDGRAPVETDRGASLRSRRTSEDEVNL